MLIFNKTLIDKTAVQLFRILQSQTSSGDLFA